MSQRNPGEPRDRRWLQTHPDTGITLRFIKQQFDRGNKNCSATEFRDTPDGIVLDSKWGPKRVAHNFKNTKANFLVDINPATRGQGGFTEEVRAIAGLKIPEREDNNREPPLVPGDDGEDLEEDDYLGGVFADEDDDEDDPVPQPASHPEPKFVSKPKAEPTVPARKSSMTFVSHIIATPDVTDREREVECTCFSLYLQPPAGVTEVTAELNDDLKGVTWMWREPEGAHRHDVIGRDTPDQIQGSIRRTLDEMHRDDTTLLEIGGIWYRRHVVTLPEPVENYLISLERNRFGQRPDPVQKTPIPGTTAMACWVGIFSKANHPIRNRGVYTGPSQEEISRTANLFGFASPLQAQQAAQQAADQARRQQQQTNADSTMMREMLQRLRRQEEEMQAMKSRYEEQLSSQRRAFETTTNQLHGQYEQHQANMAANSPRAFSILRQRGLNNMTEEEFATMLNQMRVQPPAADADGTTERPRPPPVETVSVGDGSSSLGEMSDDLLNFRTPNNTYE